VGLELEDVAAGNATALITFEVIALSGTLFQWPAMRTLPRLPKHQPQDHLKKPTALEETVV